MLVSLRSLPCPVSLETGVIATHRTFQCIPICMPLTRDCLCAGAGKWQLCRDGKRIATLRHQQQTVYTALLRGTHLRVHGFARAVGPHARKHFREEHVAFRVHRYLFLSGTGRWCTSVSFGKRWPQPGVVHATSTPIVP